jgi:hypothetical protein
MTRVYRHDRRAEREAMWLKAGHAAFVLTVLISAFSLVLSPYSLIWPGPDIRLGTNLSLLPRMIPVMGMLATAGIYIWARGRATIRRPLRHLMPAPIVAQAILAVWMLGAGTYAKVVDQNPDTFFTVGAALLAGPCAFLCWELSGDAKLMDRTFVICLIIGSLPILASSIAKLFSEDGAFSEYYPVAFAALGLSWFRWRHPAARTTVGVLALFLCLLSRKKTGIIACGALVVPVMVDAIVRRWGVSLRSGMLFLAAAVLVAVLTAAGLWLGQESFRSGEHAFRQYSFEVSWQQFLESPLWGQWYLGSSAIHNPYYPTVRIAVHNDILDVMRQGGVLAMGLFLMATLSPWWVLWCHRKRWADIPGPILGGATAITGTYAIIAFNPTLLTPDIAVIIWTLAGSTVWHEVAFVDSCRVRDSVAWRYR